MTKSKKYRLWTFQNVRAIEELKSKAVLETSWNSYSATDLFTKSYQWMAKQMAIRSISCNGAPIWAWHSCNKYKHPPTLANARTLLSDIDLIAGIRTIEFECPVELVLLSNYGHWNHLLYNVFPFAAENEIDKETVSKLFDTDPAKFMKYDSIQAALPYLKLDWVKEVRELNLKPNDFTYDAEEEV